MKQPDKWSRRKTVAFIVMVCAIFWIAVVAAVKAFALSSTMNMRYQDYGNRVEISDCHGGVISHYERQFRLWEDAGKSVVFRGSVSSACTIGLGFDNVSWTARAQFLFHQGRCGGEPCERATQEMVSYYPDELLNCLSDPTSWNTRYPRDRSISGAEMTRILNGECNG